MKGTSSSYPDRLVHKLYTNNTTYDDEWYITSYGTKTHRVLTQSQRGSINCHGYAMFLNEAPIYTGNQYWWHRGDSYRNYVFANNLVIDSTVKNNLSLYTKQDFEEWLSYYNFDWQFEDTFSLNGENVRLADNQYRVVLRTGIIKEDTRVRADYHFWYQNYNGTWSDKHGLTTEEHLPAGVIPSSTNTSVWNLGSYANFYDGIIYSYIITEN